MLGLIPIKKYTFFYICKTSNIYLHYYILGWFCPAYWDDIACWPVTAAHNVATIQCPSYIVGFDKPVSLNSVFLL